jgi:hypothetical protein
MLTQQDCLDALAAGKTLTNGQTYVHLDEFGSQIISGHIRKSHRPYTFDSPQYWHVYVPHKPESLDLSTYFVIALAFVLGLSMYFYNAYITSEARCESLQKAHAELWLEYDADHRQLELYQTTEAQLKDLGASTEQARAIIKAAEVHNVNPKF